MLSDTYKQKGRRKRLLKELEEMGIRSKRVLLAMEKTPRHFFFPEDFEGKAYENIAFPIEAGQTISQPYTVAYQTELLDIKKGDKVLEVGTGSGYQGAVLKVLGADVYTIETKKTLYTKSKALYSKLGLKINSFYGDGSKGLPDHAPFDKILLTAAAPKLAKTLTKQLKLGGKLVAPVGDKTVQNMILIERIGENDFKETQYGRFTFVPLTGKHGWTD